MTSTRRHPERTDAPRAWLLLYGALAASAGHGLFLYVALKPAGWIPDFARMIEQGGARNAAVVAWFMASIPLTLLALALRRPLQRRAWLTPCALLAAGVALAAFALYAQTILDGPG